MTKAIQEWIDLGRRKLVEHVVPVMEALTTDGKTKDQFWFVNGLSWRVLSNGQRDSYVATVIKTRNASTSW
jgi:hypothetical protein